MVASWPVRSRLKMSVSEVLRFRSRAGRLWFGSQPGSIASNRYQFSQLLKLRSRWNFQKGQPPKSRAASRHGVLGPVGLYLLGQAHAICRADCEVKRGPLSLACSPNIHADRSKNRSASGSARTRRYAPCPSVGRGVSPLMESARQSPSNRRSDAKSAV